MSHDLYTYGSQEPVSFALVTNTGASYTGHLFVATDVYLVVDGGGGDIDVSSACTEVGKGIYIWTPASATHTQRKVIRLAITDSSGGGAFIDNKVIMVTGGNASAFFAG